MSRLKLYYDGSLDKEVNMPHVLDKKVIMPHVLNSETEIVVHRLVCLVDYEDERKVQIRWSSLLDTEDTLEPIEQIYKNVPELFFKLLKRKNTPLALAEKAR